MTVDLGRIGIWRRRDQLTPRLAKDVEELGYGAIWIGGSPPGDLFLAQELLDATEHLAVATGIVNMWATPAGEAAASYHRIAAAHPGRFLLGVGIGHPEATQEYRAPLTVMREFLDRLDVPKERLCLAALGPKMLELSKERTLGAAPYFTPAAHTRVAREQLGAGTLIAPEVAFVLGDDVGVARDYAQGYLALGNYARNLERLGYADLASDSVLADVVPHGSVETIEANVQAHFDAGADHVCVQALGEPGIPEQGWTALAPR